MFAARRWIWAVPLALCGFVLCSDRQPFRLGRELKRHLVVYVLCSAAFWVVGSILFQRLNVYYYPAVIVALGSAGDAKLAQPRAILLVGLLAQMVVLGLRRYIALTPRLQINSKKHATPRNTIRETIRPDAGIQRAFDLSAIIDRVLAVQLPVAVELVCVDDGSSDGSWEELQKLAVADTRVRAFRQERNCGKGPPSARPSSNDRRCGRGAGRRSRIRPGDYMALLGPILDGPRRRRFRLAFRRPPAAGPLLLASRRQRYPTLLSNMANDVDLTDMETCYKMVRADVLSELRLKATPSPWSRRSPAGWRNGGADLRGAHQLYRPHLRRRKEDPAPATASRPCGRCSSSRFLDVRIHAARWLLRPEMHVAGAHAATAGCCGSIVPTWAAHCSSGAGIGNFSLHALQLRTAGPARPRAALREIPAQPPGRARARLRRAGRSGRGEPASTCYNRSGSTPSCA